MGAAERRQHDSAMASRMKELGITRTTGKCSICQQLVSLAKMQGHIERSCPGPQKGRLK